MDPEAPFGTAALFAFDAYGTLFDFAAAARRCSEALGDKAEALGRLWRVKQIGYTWHRSLTGCHADFRQVTEEALDYAMAELGIDQSALRQRLLDLYRAPDPFPDALDTLAKLKAAGRRTLILSNGTPDMLRSAVDAAGLSLHLDEVLSVESAGIFKPHPASYRLVSTRFGVDPETVAFVSGNAWDCAGAAVFGFRTIWVNRTGEPKDGLPGSPERIVPALGEIPALAGVA
jgi:2-haloacid dehalogenase